MEALKRWILLRLRNSRSMAPAEPSNAPSSSTDEATALGCRHISKWECFWRKGYQLRCLRNAFLFLKHPGLNQDTFSLESPPIYHVLLFSLSALRKTCKASAVPHLPSRGWRIGLVTNWPESRWTACGLEAKAWLRCGPRGRLCWSCRMKALARSLAIFALLPLVIPRSSPLLVRHWRRCRLVQRWRLPKRNELLLLKIQSPLPAR